MVEREINRCLYGINLSKPKIFCIRAGSGAQARVVRRPVDKNRRKIFKYLSSMNTTSPTLSVSLKETVYPSSFPATPSSDLAPTHQVRASCSQTNFRIPLPGKGGFAAATKTSIGAATQCLGRYLDRPTVHRCRSLAPLLYERPQATSNVVDVLFVFSRLPSSPRGATVRQCQHCHTCEQSKRTRLLQI